MFPPYILLVRWKATDRSFEKENSYYKISSSPAMNTFELIESNLVRYFCIALLILGTFGNTLNIIIFTRPKLRSIPCSWYFLASTCGNLIALYMGCLTRVLATFGINPRTKLQSAVYCKTRSYFTYGNLSLSIWFVIGACVDRWASSCTTVRIRSISNVKIAKRVIVGIVFIVYLVYAQMFFCFDGVYEAKTSGCFTISRACELYNSFALFFTYSFLPCLLMLIFGLLTIQNIRHTRQRIVPLNLILNNRNKKKTIKQMTIMLLVQVVCSILLSLPISLQNIYNEITRNYQKSDEQKQMENFLGTLFSLITLMNSSISFYIFTLTGQIFRDELKRLLFFKIRVPITAD
jgi:hypothetical protein